MADYALLAALSESDPPCMDPELMHSDDSYQEEVNAFTTAPSSPTTVKEGDDYLQTEGDAFKTAPNSPTIAGLNTSSTIPLGSPLTTPLNSSSTIPLDSSSTTHLGSHIKSSGSRQKEDVPATATKPSNGAKETKSLKETDNIITSSTPRGSTIFAEGEERPLSLPRRVSTKLKRHSLLKMFSPKTPTRQSGKINEKSNEKEDNAPDAPSRLTIDPITANESTMTPPESLQSFPYEAMSPQFPSPATVPSASPASPITPSTFFGRMKQPQTPSATDTSPSNAAKRAEKAAKKAEKKVAKKAARETGPTIGRLTFNADQVDAPADSDPDSPDLTALDISPEEEHSRYVQDLEAMRSAVPLDLNDGFMRMLREDREKKAAKRKAEEEAKKAQEEQGVEGVEAKVAPTKGAEEAV